MDPPFGAIIGPLFSYLAAAKDNLSVICPLLAVSQGMAATIRDNLRGTATLDVTDDIPDSWFERNGCLLVDVRSLKLRDMAAVEDAAGPRRWHVLSHLTATTKLHIHSIPRDLSVLDQLPNSLVELSVGKGSDAGTGFQRGACDLRHLTQLTSLDFDVQCRWAGHADHQEFEGTRLPASLEKLKITSDYGDLAGMLRELPSLREFSYTHGSWTSDLVLAHTFSSMTALKAVTVMYRMGWSAKDSSWGSDGGEGVAALLSALGTRLVDLRVAGGWDVERCEALAGATNLTKLYFDDMYDKDIGDFNAMQRTLSQLPKLRALRMHLWHDHSQSDRQLAAFRAAVEAAVPEAHIIVSYTTPVIGEPPDSGSASDPESDSSEEGHDE